MRLAATLEYDGTEFSGFQRQNNAETIQEHIESSLKKITNENITINREIICFFMVDEMII